MDRITVNEFIDEVKSDLSPLGNGHDLGLIIDEFATDRAALTTVLKAIARKATSVSIAAEHLTSPLPLKRALERVNGGDVLVLIHADRQLSPGQHAALMSLVEDHALRQWNQQNSWATRVSFPEKSRFVLVTSRQSLEESWSRYPSLKRIIGVTMSCDAFTKEVM